MLLEAKNFLISPCQFKHVTKETRYHISITELLKQNPRSQIAELFQRPRTMLKILYFSWERQFLQKSPGKKFLHDRGRKLFHLLAGEEQFVTEEARSVNLSTGKVTGAHLTGVLGQGV